MLFSITSTSQLLLTPFDAFAVIIAFPLLIPVTIPNPSTVAIFVFDELHVIALFVAFDGLTVAVNLVFFLFLYLNFYLM